MPQPLSVTRIKVTPPFLISTVIFAVAAPIRLTCLGIQDVPAELPVLHASKLGRVHTLIMRMNAQEATERLMAYSPLLVDAIPLTLEEIFIYELGGADYAVKDIVL